jgi:hypothetical protein
VRSQSTPQRGIRRALPHRRRGLEQQRLQHLQRQTHPRPAIGRRFDRRLAQVPQRGHGGVEVENLLNEQVNGLHRPQLPLSPAMLGLRAGRHDGLVGEKWTQIVLDPLQRR